jgi:hypothetical protein
MRVLLLGDSHTHGAYGAALEKLFKAAGHQVTRVGWVSANASHYLNGSYAKLKLGHTGDFNKDVKGKAFDLAILSLGTNDAAGTNSDASANAAIGKIKQLADSITAGKLYWVGPPAFHPESARKYSPAFASDDLNKKSARVWQAGQRVFGSAAIDPRSATQPYVGTMAPTKKLPKGDIHFQKAGGDAWAKFVFDTVGGGSLPAGTTVAVATSDQSQSSDSAVESGDSKVPMYLAIGAVVVLGYLLFFRPKASARQVMARQMPMPMPMPVQQF